LLAGILTSLNAGFIRCLYAVFTIVAATAPTAATATALALWIGLLCVGIFGAGFLGGLCVGCLNRFGRWRSRRLLGLAGFLDSDFPCYRHGCGGSRCIQFRRSVLGFLAAVASPSAAVAAAAIGAAGIACARHFRNGCLGSVVAAGILLMTPALGCGG
jgi:hypothetical protein